MDIYIVVCIQAIVCFSLIIIINTVLLFSACRDDEYTCTDGKCIDATRACDGSPDCTDGDDEKNCNHYYELYSYYYYYYQQQQQYAIVIVIVLLCSDMFANACMYMNMCVRVFVISMLIQFFVVPSSLTKQNGFHHVSLHMFLREFVNIKPYIICIHVCKLCIVTCTYVSRNGQRSNFRPI